MKEPIIFLDRDGVLCKEKGYITSIEQMEIFSYSKKAVAIMHDLLYNVIVITNQSAVARGLITEIKLSVIHKYLKEKTNVDAIYYCPHYPPDAKESLPYRINCKCRKPNIKLLQTAIKQYNFDSENSFFVGDRATDILTGQTFGIKTILLESGYGTKKLEQEVKPDYIFGDLLKFAYFLKGDKNK